MGGKRKRQGSFVPDDMYEVEAIQARRLVKGKPEYLIRWKGFSEKHDTWEPLSNLAGIEQDLSRFEAEEKRANEEYRLQLEEMRKQKAVNKAAAEEQRRAAQQPLGGSLDLQPAADTAATHQGQPDKANKHAKTAKIWDRYAVTGNVNEKGVKEYKCAEVVGNDRRLCG